MTESSRDLWPPDLGTVSVVPPVAILREQAAALAKKTKGLLEGEVISRPERHSKGSPAAPFLHEFRIRAPAFGDYRYLLLDVRHDFDMYPVLVRFRPTDEETSAGSPEEFVSQLADLFSRPETRRVVEALLSQLTGAEA